LLWLLISRSCLTTDRVHHSLRRPAEGGTGEREHARGDIEIRRSGRPLRSDVRPDLPLVPAPTRNQNEIESEARAR